MSANDTPMPGYYWHCPEPTSHQPTARSLRCLIYARSATVGRHSLLTSQLSLCKRLIDSMGRAGWTHTQTISESGISGLRLRRPGLLRALSELKHGRAEIIVTADAARLSRAIDDLEEIRAYVGLIGGRIASPLPCSPGQMPPLQFRQFMEPLLALYVGGQCRKRSHGKRVSRAVAQWEALGANLSSKRSQKGGTNHE